MDRVIRIAAHALTGARQTGLSIHLASIHKRSKKAYFRLFQSLHLPRSNLLQETYLCLFPLTHISLGLYSGVRVELIIFFYSAFTPRPFPFG
jgi:hypothetical protein